MILQNRSASSNGCWGSLFGTGILAITLALSLAPGLAGAQVYTPNATGPYHWSVNSHYYQTWTLTSTPANYTFAELENFVNSLSFNGLQGHLATYETYDELLWGGTNSQRGYVGAYGNNTQNGYVWSAISASVPVTFWGSVFVPDTTPICPPYSRLYLTGAIGTWRGSSENIGCDPHGFSGTSMFTVEFEAGVVPAHDESWGHIKALYR